MAEKTEKSNRWVLNVILILATVALLGVSMIPPILGLFQQQTPPKTAASPSPTQSASPNQVTLADQARGYEAILKEEPNNQTALRGLFDARLRQGDVKGSLEPLEKLAQLNPNEADYMVLLGQGKAYVGDREGAAQAYRTVLTTKPGNLNALQGLVSLLVDEKRPEAAIVLLQDTLKDAPKTNQAAPGSVDVTAVQVLLGKVYANQKRYDDAIATFDQAIKTNKQDFQPVLYKALALKEQGKDAEAKPLFETALSLAPPQAKDQIKQMAGLAPAPSPGATAPSVAPGAPAPGAAPGTAPVPAPGATPAPASPAPANP